jgi:hypothetical protein
MTGVKYRLHSQVDSPKKWASHTSLTSTPYQHPLHSCKYQAAVAVSREVGTVNERFASLHGKRHHDCHDEDGQAVDGSGYCTSKKWQK